MTVFDNTEVSTYGVWMEHLYDDEHFTNVKESNTKVEVVDKKTGAAVMTFIQVVGCSKIQWHEQASDGRQELYTTVKLDQKNQIIRWTDKNGNEQQQMTFQTYADLPQFKSSNGTSKHIHTGDGLLVKTNGSVVTWEKYKTRRQQQQAYDRKPKGKARHRGYGQSEKGKKRKQNYRNRAEGRRVRVQVTMPDPSTIEHDPSTEATIAFQKEAIDGTLRMADNLTATLTDTLTGRYNDLVLKLNDSNKKGRSRRTSSSSEAAVAAPSSPSPTETHNEATYDSMDDDGVEPQESSGCFKAAYNYGNQTSYHNKNDVESFGGFGRRPSYKDCDDKSTEHESDDEISALAMSSLSPDGKENGENYDDGNKNKRQPPKAAPKDSDNQKVVPLASSTQPRFSSFSRPASSSSRYGDGQKLFSSPSSFRLASFSSSSRSGSPQSTSLSKSKTSSYPEEKTIDEGTFDPKTSFQEQHLRSPLGATAGGIAAQPETPSSPMPRAASTAMSLASAPPSSEKLRTPSRLRMPPPRSNPGGQYHDHEGTPVLYSAHARQRMYERGGTLLEVKQTHMHGTEVPNERNHFSQEELEAAGPTKKFVGPATIVTDREKNVIVSFLPDASHRNKRPKPEPVVDTNFRDGEEYVQYQNRITEEFDEYELYQSGRLLSERENNKEQLDRVRKSYEDQLDRLRKSYEDQLDRLRESNEKQLDRAYDQGYDRGYDRGYSRRYDDRGREFTNGDNRRRSDGRGYSVRDGRDEDNRDPRNSRDDNESVDHEDCLSSASPRRRTSYLDRGIVDHDFHPLDRSRHYQGGSQEDDNGYQEDSSRTSSSRRRGRDSYDDREIDYQGGPESKRRRR